LNANGHLRLNNCSVGDLRLYNGAVNFSWQERKLTLNDCRIVMPNTAFKLDLERWPEGALAVTAEGVVDLSNFQSLTVKFGRINGQTGFALRYNSSPDNYDLTASFWANKLNLNNLYFDNITGSLNYRDGQLTCLEPISFRHQKDLYSLSGSAFWPPDNLAHSSLDLNLEIVQSDLANAYRLFRDLQGEASRRLALASGNPVIKLNPADLALPASRAAAVKDSTLYYSSATDKYFLKSWQKVRAEFEKKSTVVSEEALGGSLSGQIQLKGPISQLTGRLDASIDSGTFRTFAFDNLQTSLTLKDNDLKITKAVLTKGTGNLTARGDYNFNGNVALQVVADSMPLNVLTVIFPKKEFKGAFNMKAELDGPISDLRLTLSAACKNITLAGISFDEAFIAAAKKGDAVFLHKVSLRQGPRLSSLHGSWQLGRPGQISLDANLQGDSVGLMNLFSDDIRWIKGDSSISAKVSGTLEQPKIQGRAQVSNGTIYVKAIDSELRNLQGSAEVANNVIQLDRLTGTWYGQRTNYWPNPIGLAGTIDIDKLLAAKGRINLNLTFSPTHLYIALPNLYTGSLHVNALRLQGPLNLDFSQGPTLSGQLAIDNTVLALPRGGAASEQTFPLEFNLEASLGKNTYVTMGDVFSTDLSNIMMNLEVASNDFKIMGSLQSPSLLGKVAIKRGTVNIFNREFTLLSVDAQKKYFPYDTEKIKDNSAVFAGGNGPEAAVPDLTITSAVNVETQEKDVSGKYVKKPVNVLARLSGNPSAREERSSLKITLLGFTEDKTKSPAELTPTAYSEQELKVMLLPDFIKSLAGIGQEGEKTQVDTNAVVADYLSSRVQTILFRGLERELEQKLGLESLTLEYNLGPKVKEAMGVRDVKGFTETKPTWSVGFVKGFFDRLYIDMRYSEGVSQTSSGSGANSNFNYQLTYKLTPIWAIIYYREPMNLSDFAAGYQKVTLKAGFSFW
ncbi:MAG: translocation/assembly module TamB domain-containing protein, partial [Candidatus Margulisbacteria bacterium]|nr:translocation/assembly module TamB domain-containing protein [Candidatus Margulisiibacteriota bacterium]